MTSRFPCSGRIGPSKSRGVVLFVALVFLILLTLLALSSSTNSLLQEKMVGSTRNKQMANFGAESALRQAESRLWSARTMGNTGFVNCRTDGTTPCYRYDPDSPTAAVQAFRNSKGWVNAGTQKFDATGQDLTAASLGSAKLAANPVYIIEDLGLETPPGTGPLHESEAKAGGGVTGFENHLYRITARSQGGNNKVVSAMQSIFAAKAN